MNQKYGFGYFSPFPGPLRQEYNIRRKKYFAYNFFAYYDYAVYYTISFSLFKNNNVIRNKNDNIYESEAQLDGQTRTYMIRTF